MSLFRKMMCAAAIAGLAAMPLPALAVDLTMYYPVAVGGPVTKIIDAKLIEQGWQDLAALLNETLERANGIQDEATNRLAADKGNGIQTKLAILAFETPSES